MSLTTEQRIEIRKNNVRRMEFEMEDLMVRHSVQENLGQKKRMEQLEEDMADLQKSITLVEGQIKDLEAKEEKELKKDKSQSK